MNTTFNQLKPRIDLDVISYPVHCPECGTETTVNNNMPFCPNYTCPGRIYGRVLKFVESLDIKGVGEETIRGLVQAGWVAHPAGLYEVTKDQFISLDRKGEKHFKKFQDGLAAKRVVDWYDFMGALSIDEAAEGTFKSIAQAGFDTVEKWDTASPAQLAKAENVTDRKARVMKAAWLKQKEDVLSMIELGRVRFRKAETENAITGKTVCLTGTLSRSRKHYEDLIKASGGFIGGSVGKKTHILVAANPESNSSKMKKAGVLGVEIIGEDELTTRLGG